MRTIRFRGKKVTNGVWAYGSLVYLDKNGAAIYVQTDNGSAKVMDLAYVDPNTVCQFTGFLDKNRKEIYEGDILKVAGLGKKIEVRFVRGSFAFLWNGDLYDEAAINAPTQKWAEVIGNIHDNPKL